MHPKQSHLILLIVIIVLLLAGAVYAFLLPSGIGAAAANNIWSLRFIGASASERLSDPIKQPPTSHLHAGLLLAHQALAEGENNLALQYLAPLVAANDPMAADTFAEISFLNADYLTALDTWKALDAYKSLEWASHELSAKNELGFTALARRYACEIRSDIFGCYRLDLGIRNANELRDNGFLGYSLPIYADLAIRYPSESVVYYELAWAYALDGRSAPAAENITKALALKTDSLDFYLRAGILFEQNAQRDQAITAYNAALALEANNPLALEGLQRLATTP